MKTKNYQRSKMPHHHIYVTLCCSHWIPCFEKVYQ